jgi:hypothetical protein
MGLFKKRPPLDPKDELQLHKIEISAMWSEKEQRFVSYDTMHVEGEVNRLAGLMHKIGTQEPVMARMIEKAYKGPNLINKKRSAIEEHVKSMPAKPISTDKAISDMTPEEIEKFIRDNDMESKDD